MRIGLLAFIFSLIVSGCTTNSHNYSKNDIVKIIDFELSPDENKIAFSAITAIGNLDIWVVDIDGKNLKKLTFQDRSPTNHIARYFKRHKWRNFFEIDMCQPQWTKDGGIVFCQKLSRHDRWGVHTVSLRFWTINPDTKYKRHKASDDETLNEKQFTPIHRFKTSVQSDKHKKTILLKNDTLWILDYGLTTPQKLIR